MTTSSPPCPPTPKSERPEDLKFERRDMVRWFDPQGLVRAGVLALISAIFGEFADKRDFEGFGQGDAEPQVYPPREDGLWIDYVADIGDGWNSTYSIAWLLSRPSLLIGGSAGPRDLPRGNVLVLGGDQVYPVACRDDYTNRIVGPLGAALPAVLPEPKAPDLYAIPGNHDWYDGLTTFMRIFCQGNWLGGWKTRQRRSYFALQLPGRWWLWGIDSQLDTYFDLPQLEYFKAIAQKNMQPGDRIILCAAEPSWIKAHWDQPNGMRNLNYFERHCIRPSGGSVAMTLTGDLHHYFHYEGSDGTHWITAGGGGAYLYGTHQLPRTLHPEPPVPGDPAVVLSATPRGAFPSRPESWRLAWGVLLMPIKNPGFGVLLGAIYLLLAWFLQSASYSRGGASELFYGRLAVAPHLRDVLALSYSMLLGTPLAIFLVLGLLAGLVGFCAPPPSLRGFTGKAARWFGGLLHGCAHLLLALLLTWALVRIYHLAGHEPRGFIHGLYFGVAMLSIGGAIGGALFGFYLFVGNLFRFHRSDVWAAQAIPDFKSFLRMHLAADGSLTLYPIGVRRACSGWRFQPGAKDGDAWFAPASGTIGVELIEEPTRLAATGGQA